jgi:excisionase family DNA binding protein
MVPNETSLLWSVEQAAAALAISPWTVRLYVRQGKLQPIRVGRRVLFEPKECLRFLEICKTATRNAPAFSPLQSSEKAKGSGC